MRKLNFFNGLGKFNYYRGDIILGTQKVCFESKIYKIIMDTPGKMALVALKNQDKAIQSVFKTPNVPTVKKDKKIILSEESYLKV